MLMWNKGRKIGTILKEPLSEKPVELGLSEVSYHMELVADRAMTLQNQRIGRMDRSLNNIAARMENMDYRTQNIERLTSAVYPVVDTAYQSVDEVVRVIEAQNGLIVLLADEIRNSLCEYISLLFCAALIVSRAAKA